MRTRKTFIHEDGIYEGTSRLPEPRENNPIEIVSLNNSYDWYPEKEPEVKKEPSKIDGFLDVPLGEEYKLKTQIDNYSHSTYRDTHAMSVILEEINNMSSK
jgi:hypothetical protein